MKVSAAEMKAMKEMNQMPAGQDFMPAGMDDFGMGQDLMPAPMPAPAPQGSKAPYQSENKTPVSAAVFWILVMGGFIALAVAVQTGAEWAKPLADLFK